MRHRLFFAFLLTLSCSPLITNLIADIPNCTGTQNTETLAFCANVYQCRTVSGNDCVQTTAGPLVANYVIWDNSVQVGTCRGAFFGNGCTHCSKLECALGRGFWFKNSFDECVDPAAAIVAWSTNCCPSE